MDPWQGYTIVGRVAEQRRSRVWKARDVALGRDVAIKELAPIDHDDRGPTVEEWRREAQVLATLDHPNIVAVYDFQESGGRAAIIEEWVDGATLSAVVKRHGRLDPPQGLAVARGALRGLAHAHDRGVVHGDISDSNVMVGTDGESRLVDFGLASADSSPSPGSSSGTSAFRAPEVPGSAPTPASDVYSAGAVITAMLRGEASLQPSTEGIPRPVRDVLDRALDPDPARRYPDAGEFLAALEEAAQSRYGPAWWSQAGLGAAAGSAMSGLVVVSAVPGGSGAGPGATAAQAASVAVRSAKAAGGHRALIGAGIAAAALVVGGAAAYAMTQRSDPPARNASAVGAPGAGARGAAAGTTGSASGSSASSRATPSTTTRPASWPGRYATHVVLTKITGGFFDKSTVKVGQTSGTTWTLTAACATGPCGLTATSAKGTVLRLTYGAGSWSYSQKGTVQCGIPGQKLSKTTTTFNDRLVLTGTWSDRTPPALTGTETVVYAPCKGSTTPSTLTYSVLVTPSG
jgi:serine/threonine-protein kinase